MIDAIYFVFFWLLVIEVILFVFISLPLPDRFKRKVVNTLTQSKFMNLLLKIHLGSCVLAGLFFLDLYQTEKVYTDEKERLKQEGHGHTG